MGGQTCLPVRTLEKAAQTAVSWVTLNLARFQPFVAGQLTADGIKALSELAILYSVLKDRSRAGRDSWIENAIPTWRSFLIEQCETPKYAQMSRKRPGQAFYLLMPYLCLRRSGYRTPYYEQTLRLLKRWRYPGAIEVVPHRLLDRHYFLWKAGLKLAPKWSHHYRATSLPHMTHPQYLDDDAAYVFTHTLFYLTDFGRHRPALEQRDLQHLSRLGEYLSIHSWRLRLWDILGELLIGLCGLERQRSRLFIDAANAFRGAQNEDGSIPPNDEALPLNTSDDPEASSFRHRYHTTLVMALFALALIDR